MYHFSRKFQFTPLREGRRHKVVALLALADISIHAPPRGATRFRISVKGGRKYFNSRPSARGDRTAQSAFWSLSIFQFTPLREGRRTSADRRRTSMEISIHAPPRGATRHPASLSSQACRFQFTPLREGRPLHIDLLYNRLNFNSRPSARGDYRNYATQEVNLISIHAPPRGATRQRRHLPLALDFNSRPSARGDRGVVGTPDKIVEHFNSRPSARGDGFVGFDVLELIHFNSRPSARGDTSQSTMFPASSQFQFTPLREGRLHEAPPKNA